MKTNNVFFVFLLSSFFIYSEAVEVYKVGTNGKPSWRETSEMRDRSNVPTPSQKDVDDYRRRSRIPVPVVTNYRSRSSDIPKPSREDVLADYYRRSKIPIPINSKFRKRFQVPVSQLERTKSGTHFKTQSRRAANRHSSLLQKKNIIDSIFFTIPFGAQFPIYFASKSKKGASKKSNVASPVQRSRAPNRLQTWRLPINYQVMNNKRYFTPFVENQAIARQHIIPAGALAYNRGYSRPRSFTYPRLLSNRNLVPYSSYRNQASTVPRQLQTFLNRRVRRGIGLKRSKLSKGWYHCEQQQQNNKDNDNDNECKDIIQQEQTQTAAAAAATTTTKLKHTEIKSLN
ncbi:uncharacterized protein LOC116295989 [Actinia tenebrosa]|uniref:Uncharacterized protein LOC116295989 n=1 Tax=Actinia tenebrosa TaxID=6105 RepID=A0A6P8HWW0_ACTTE|nr:uncharacterized protein LOC116295989 [Actinia tenebrosa]